jgi:hypothetical protein
MHDLITCVVGKKNGYVISLRIRDPGGPGFRWEGGTDMNDKEGGNWIKLAQNSIQRRAPLSTVISLRVAGRKLLVRVTTYQLLKKDTLNRFN